MLDADKIIDAEVNDESKFLACVLGGDIGWITTRKGVGRGDCYRVLLIDDPKHTEKLGMLIILLLSLKVHNNFVSRRLSLGQSP